MHENCLKISEQQYWYRPAAAKRGSEERAEEFFFSLKILQTPPVSVHNGKKLEPELRREGY